MYVVEVQAVTDTTYRLVTAGDLSSTGSLAETQVKAGQAQLSQSDLAVLQKQDAALRDAQQTMPQSTHLPSVDKARPDHPFTLSTPYQYVQEVPLPGEAPTIYTVYLPVMTK